MSVWRSTFQKSISLPWLFVGVLTVFFLALSVSVVLSSPRVPIQEWTETTALPQALASHRAVVHENYLYVVGGKNAGDNPVGIVYAAQIQSNGSLGSWNVVATLPTPVYLHTVVASNEHLYVIGGWDGGRTRSEIWRAQFLANGGLSSFAEIANYPRNLDLHDAVIVKNRLYVIGGWTGTAPLDNVYYADITATGLGSWIAASALPKKLYRLSVAATGSTIYVSGGFDNVSAQPTVYFSRVNGDGSLQGWNQAASLPNPIYYQGSVIHDGRLLILGGRGDGPEYANVYAATINGDGSLGGWVPDLNLPESLHRFAVVAVNRNGSDYLYLLGGLHGVDYRTMVYRSAYPSPPTPTPTPTPSPTPGAALSISLTNSPQRWVAPGEEITYTVHYRNNSANTISNLVIQNLIPAHVELIAESLEVRAGVTVTHTGTTPGSTVRWTIATLAPSERNTLSFRVRRPLPRQPAIPRVLAISSSGPAQATAGAPISYSIVVTNNTAFPITNLLVVGTVPNGAQYIRGGDSVTADRIQWTIPSLAGDSSITREFVVSATRTIVNSDYYVSSDEGPTAKGNQVIVTRINNMDPLPSGDGIYIENSGVSATWQVNGSRDGARSNGVFNPTYGNYLPVVKR